jgi:hypothetical protein
MCCSRGGAWRGKAPFDPCVMNVLLPDHPKKKETAAKPDIGGVFSILPQVFPPVSAIDRIVSYLVGSALAVMNV